MEQFVQLAGIDWDTAIRGVLVAATGVVILCGSVYLLLATNLGARLGFLVAAGGLAGWMFILGITWWLWPPAIGPRGELPSWEAIDIVYGPPSGSAEEVAADLPNLCWSTRSASCEPSGGGTVAEALLESNPQLAEELGSDATLSEIANVADASALSGVDTGGWRIVGGADAGEAVTAASEALVPPEGGEKLFERVEDFMVLDTFERGGKEPLPADPSRWDRISHWVTSSLQLTHPTHYAVVQVQPVVEQDAEPGQAPPPAVADEGAQVISVVLVRDLGTLRVPGFLVMVVSGIVLGTVAYALHRRDLLAAEHQAAAGES